MRRREGKDEMGNKGGGVRRRGEERRLPVLVQAEVHSNARTPKGTKCMPVSTGPLVRVYVRTVP